MDHGLLCNDYFPGSPKTHSAYMSVQQMLVLEEFKLRTAEKFAVVKMFQCRQDMGPNLELTQLIDFRQSGQLDPPKDHSS